MKRVPLLRRCGDFLARKRRKYANAARSIRAIRDAGLPLRDQMRHAVSFRPVASPPGSAAKFVIHSRREMLRVASTLELWTAKWVETLPDDAVLWDIGANIGLFTIFAALRPQVRRVVALEPSSLNFSSLMQNVHLNGVSHKVVGLHAGLGPATGVRTLNLQNADPGGAFHSFGEFWKTPKQAPGVEWCPLWSLDDLVRVDGVPFPTHLKIDVDGYELPLLAGAAATLADPRLKAIQIEVMERAGQEAAKEQVVATLEDAGFGLVRRIHHGGTSEATDLQFSRG